MMKELFTKYDRCLRAFEDILAVCAEQGNAEIAKIIEELMDDIHNINYVYNPDFTDNEEEVYENESY